MNCRERQEFFSDLYDGNLPADRRLDLESHLAACTECRVEYESFSISLHALREAAQHETSELFVRRVVDSARNESERVALFHNTGLKRPTTRRSIAPRRAVWAVPAIAAAALVAFALGFIIQKQAGDREIKDLQERLARADRERVTQSVDSHRPIRTNEEIINLWLKEQNVVQVDGAWMSASLRDQLAAARKEIDRLLAEAKKPGAPGTPDEKAIEALVFEKHGLSRHGAWILPSAVIEALNAGRVLEPGGETRDLAEIVREKFRDLGLVEHDGRWMRPEEKSSLLAARRIHNSGGHDSPVAGALEGLEIGAPLGFRNLVLYPLIASGDRPAGVATLAEALAGDRVEITEEVTVSALQVRVRNKGDAPLAIFAGEVLVGGRHGRVVARDVLVPAKKERTIDVFDAEPSELRPQDKTAFRRESGQTWASLGLRRLLNEEAGQAAVWASTGRMSISDHHRDHRAAILEFRTALADLRASHPGMVGVAVAIGDSVASLEAYGSPALFAANFDRVIESAALEAIVINQRETRFPSDLPATPISVRRLAESAFSAEADVDGDSIVLKRNGRIAGRALASDGATVRVLLFPEGQPVPRLPVELAVSREKVQHVLKGYDARLKSPNVPPARRAAALREVAMIPGDSARDLVLSHLKGPLRREAIEALGQRGDPASAEPLLRLLKEARGSVPLYTSVAQALARIGGEDAAKALLEDLDPKTPDLAKAAAEHLPGLVAGLKNVNTVEVMMSQMIQSLSRLEGTADTQGQAWPHRTLMIATGKNFVKQTDYLIWWNNPKDRADFLERLKR